MSEGSITLSPKHGVNPSITHCECCGKEIGIVMFGRLKGDVEAPRDVSMGLCDDCQSVVDQKGLIILEAADKEGKPERTGRMVGITKEAKERIFKDVSSSIVYMEPTLFQQLFGDSEFKQY